MSEQVGAKLILEDILSRGPWHGVRPEDDTHWTLTTYEVRKAYETIVSGKNIRDYVIDILGVVGLSHPKANRAMQLLRKAGLICFVEGKWKMYGDENENEAAEPAGPLTTDHRPPTR